MDMNKKNKEKVFCEHCDVLIEKIVDVYQLSDETIVCEKCWVADCNIPHPDSSYFHNDEE